MCSPGRVHCAACAPAPATVVDAGDVQVCGFFFPFPSCLKHYRPESCLVRVSDSVGIIVRTSSSVCWRRNISPVRCELVASMLVVTSKTARECVHSDHLLPFVC